MSEHDRRGSSRPGPGASSLVQPGQGHAPLAPGKQTLVQQLAAPAPAVAAGTEPRNVPPTAGVPAADARDIVGDAQLPLAGLIQRASGHHDVGNDFADGAPALTLGAQTHPDARIAALSPDGGPVQRKPTAAGAAGPDQPPPPGGGGTPLSPDVRARMEAALGASFAAVRVHQDTYAQAIGAQAFTRGTDIFFAPGRSDPSSPQGLELLGHELTHVKQQAEGRVPVTAQIGGAPANDDPALEREADELGAKAARGAAAQGAAAPQAEPGPQPAGAPATSASHAPTQAKTEPDADDGVAPGPQPRVEELDGPEAADAADTSAAATAPIQRAPTGQPQKASKGEKQFIPFRITIGKPMTRDEFEAAANLQVFGTAAVSSRWHNVKDAYTPADSPVEVLFEASLVHRMRGAANAARGIDTDATGKVAGADARAKDFQAQPASDEKTALLAEIDRRYHAASGTAPGTRIQSSESGKSDLWRSIRDEVLFQHHYIANLPDKVKALIHTSIKGRDLTPADYDQLFRIAKKIEALPPGAAADYTSKITGTTTDLATFEAAIDGYRGELAAREQADTERATVQNKLLGLEEVYRLYREYRTTPMEAQAPGAREQLEKQLARYGFTSIDEFAAYVARFEKAFEDGAVRITLDILAKYAGKLYKESQRYQDPAVVKDLHARLGGFRGQFQEFDRNARIWNDYAAQANRDAEQGRLPGNGHIHAQPPTAEQAQAGENAKAAKAGAEAQIKDLSKDYPIFAEDDLPIDKRLDKTALARASEGQLAGVLQSHIANRTAVVAEARGQLEGKHELIYKMDKLMPTFYAEMDIQPGSIHDQIIKDKIHDDAIAKLVGGILLAIVAVALTVVSLGAATPAVVAAGASIGAAGLSTYMAYDEYKQYTAEHAVADAGFADDPSVVWLVLAIAGAGVDMAAATKAVRALAPAARTLSAGGELTDFTKAVEALQKSKQLDEKIAAAADKAAAARKAYGAAQGELSAALGKAYSFPGPFTDPDVYKALVRMAVAKIREGSHSLAGFIAELKQARLAAKLGELSPEELAKAKEAWARAEALGNLVKDPALLDMLLSRIGDAAKLERLLNVFPPTELEGIAASLKHPDRLVLVIDHVGADSGSKMIRQWVAKGQFDKLDTFMERMSAGMTKELAETAGIGAGSIVIDSNTAIALMKDSNPALKATMNAGEIARVKYIKNLPPGTELRVGNVTVGEVEGGVLATKGLPITVLRDSKEYKLLLSRLESMNIGGSKGAADRALLADVFFAKSEGGAVPIFVTGDKSVYNKLATEAGIDLENMGGKTLPELKPNGFTVTIEQRTIIVVPIAQ